MAARGGGGDSGGGGGREPGAQEASEAVQWRSGYRIGSAQAWPDVDASHRFVTVRGDAGVTSTRLTPYRKPGLFENSYRVYVSLPGRGQEPKLLELLQLEAGMSAFGAVRVGLPIDVTITQEDSRLVVKEVRAGSAAETAQIRGGDIVRAVSVPGADGRASEHVPPWQRLLRTPVPPSEQGLVFLDGKPISEYYAALAENLRTGGEDAEVVLVIERPDPDAPSVDTKMNPLKKITKLGVAGGVAYLLWDVGFWTVGGVAGAAAYYAAFNQIPDVTNLKAVAQVGGTAFAFVNVGLPLRIGLAVGSAPWIDDNVIKRFNLDASANGDTEVEVVVADNVTIRDEQGRALRGLGPNKDLLTLLSTMPINEDVMVEAVKGPGPGDLEAVVSRWSFTLNGEDVCPVDGARCEELENLIDIYGEPLRVQGTTTFYYNDEGKVQDIRAGTPSINGRRLDPPVEESDLWISMG